MRFVVNFISVLKSVTLNDLVLGYGRSAVSISPKLLRLPRVAEEYCPRQQKCNLKALEFDKE